MVKSEIYIGLHDATTKTQLFESEKYIKVLRNVCYSYKVPFSFSVQEGGYIYENGEYARENSLVLTLIDVEKSVVNDIAKDLCAFFRQESVLVTESEIQAYYVRESLKCRAGAPIKFLILCKKQAIVSNRFRFASIACFFLLYKGVGLRQVQAVRERSPFFCSQSFRGGFRIVSDEGSVPTNSTDI